MLYGILISDESAPRHFTYDAWKLWDFALTIPNDVPWMIISSANNGGSWQIEYKKDGPNLTMNKSYNSSNLNTQATTHGRQTLYKRTQETWRPSAYRRPDKDGWMTPKDYFPNPQDE